MDKNLPVSEIMSRNVIVAEKTNKFSQIQELFSKYSLHHLPVVENDSIIGIISATDIMGCYNEMAIAGIQFDGYTADEKFKLENIMTKKPLHVDPETSINQAIRIFNENNIQALPVVQRGKIEGIVTLKDLVFALWKED